MTSEEIADIKRCAIECKDTHIGNEWCQCEDTRKLIDEIERLQGTLTARNAGQIECERQLEEQDRRIATLEAEVDRLNIEYGNDVRRADELEAENKRLREGVKEQSEGYQAVLEKVDWGASFFTGKEITLLNELPFKAAALQENTDEAQQG